MQEMRVGKILCPSHSMRSGTPRSALSTHAATGFSHSQCQPDVPPGDKRERPCTASSVLPDLRTRALECGLLKPGGAGALCVLGALDHGPTTVVAAGRAGAMHQLWVATVGALLRGGQVFDFVLRVALGATRLGVLALWIRHDGVESGRSLYQEWHGTSW